MLRCTLVGIGTKRHFAAAQRTVAFGGKADIATEVRNDAFDPSRHFARNICCAAQLPYAATQAKEGRELRLGFRPLLRRLVRWCSSLRSLVPTLRIGNKLSYQKSCQRMCRRSADLKAATMPRRALIPKTLLCAALSPRRSTVFTRVDRMELNYESDQYRAVARTSWVDRHSTHRLYHDAPYRQAKCTC